MKFRKILAAALAAIIAAASVTAVAEAEDTSGDISLENSEAFPDSVFREYLKSKSIDKDENGKLSKAEREAVKTIELIGTSTSKVADLTGIGYFTKLDQLTVKCSDLTSLDLTKNTALRLLNCSENKLTTLKLPDSAVSIVCSDNELTAIDVSKCTKLTLLNCNRNKLGAIDVRKNTALVTLRCAENADIGTIELSKCPELKTLDCQGCGQTALNISSNIKLEKLNCKNNSLTKLDITGITALVAEYKKASPSADVLSYDSGVEIINNEKTRPDPVPTPVKKDPVKATIGFSGTPFTDTPVVWVNGKDVKDNKKTPDIDETKHVKTYEFTNTGLYSGGKWTVAVMPESIDTVEKFTALFTAGKLNNSGKTASAGAKNKAKASIKEGKITVTAGKEAGVVQVWLYEVKKVAGKNEVIANASLGVLPKMTTVTVMNSPSALVFAKETDIKDGVFVSGAKALSSVKVPYSESETEQAPAALYYGDKKAAISASADFELTCSDTNIIFVVFDQAGVIKVTPKEKGTAVLTLKNIQSGKSATVRVEVA